MAFLVSKISKGSKMDQIYVPKERAPGFEAGTLVVIEPALRKAIEKPKPYYYDIEYLEPIKVAIVERIFEYFDRMTEVDNVLVAGSFLEPGFKFEDVDVVAIGDNKMDSSAIEKSLSRELGLNVRVIAIGFKAMLKGISTDPLFEMLVSKFVAKRRVIFNTTREIKYKLLDLHLLKSELLMNNFDFLTGKEKYKLTRNMIAISLFLDCGELNVEVVNNEIEKQFGRDKVRLIKENMVGKAFLGRYSNIYTKLFLRIMAGIKHDSKQKQAS